MEGEQGKNAAAPLIVQARHSCGTLVPIPCAFEEDAYLNPSFCPHCQKRFFPKPPNAQPTEEQLARAKDRLDKFNQALESIGAKSKGDLPCRKPSSPSQ